MFVGVIVTGPETSAWLQTTDGDSCEINPRRRPTATGQLLEVLWRLRYQMSNTAWSHASLQPENKRRAGVARRGDLRTSGNSERAHHPRGATNWLGWSPASSSEAGRAYLEEGGYRGRIRIGQLVTGTRTTSAERTLSKLAWIQSR